MSCRDGGIPALHLASFGFLEKSKDWKGQRSLFGFTREPQVGFEVGSICVGPVQHTPKLVLSYFLNWIKVARLGLGKNKLNHASIKNVLGSI